jgi:hypothetical protein
MPRAVWLPVHSLLLALDALVAGDPSESGFEGRLAICVKNGSRPEVWSARFGARPWSGFTTAVPADTEALLVIDDEQARAILEGRSLPSPSAAAFGGDRTLLARFFERYVSFTSWLDVRAGGKRT